MAAVLLAIAIRLLGDCSNVESEARGVALGAVLVGSGAAVALAVTFSVLRWFRSPGLASGVGVLGGVAFGASSFST